MHQRSCQAKESGPFQKTNILSALIVRSYNRYTKGTLDMIHNYLYIACPICMSSKYKKGEDFIRTW